VTAVLHHKAWPLFLCGQGLLAFIFICLYLLAPEFDYMRQWVDRPLLEYVGLMMLAGITYFGLVFLIPILAGVRQSIWLLVIPGIILRLIIFPAAPIQEDDFYRYLWDGAVTAEGYNPYVSAPADVLPSVLPSTLPIDRPIAPSSASPNTSTRSSLLELAEQAGPDIVNRINYPHVHTIYPPISQLAFALGYKIKPWSLAAWRVVLLSADIATLLLLLVLLKQFDRPPLWAGVYWWNPLSITETINAGHMDMLLLPCIVAVVLFMSRLQSKKAVFMLSIATAVKLWPAILLAPLISALPERKLVKAALVVFFSLISLALLSPQIISAWYEPAAGVRVYSETWQTNAFLFDWIARVLSNLSMV